MRMRTKWSAGVGLSAATFLGFALAPSVTAGANTSGTPVKVMVIAPTQNQVANYPDFPAAATVAAKLINSTGGIGANHRPVQVTYCNDMFNPNNAATCAR